MTLVCPHTIPPASRSRVVQTTPKIDWTCQQQIFEKVDVLSVDGATTLGGRVVEKTFNTFTTTLTPTSNTLTINVAGSNTILGKPTTSAINTWAFTGVGLTNGQSITVTLILEGNTAATYGDACTVDGNAVSNGVRWSGGSPPLSTTNTDILTFVIVQDSAGTVRVFGQGNTDFS